MPFADANGLRLSYDVRGEGEPVVFVCGTAQKAAQWDLIMRPQVTDVEIPGSAHVTLDPASAAIIPKAIVEFVGKHRGEHSR